MNHKEKIEQLKALKESFAATQARLAEARRLEEAASATNLSTLLESELERAELILASKDLMSKLQKMAEDLAKMQADAMPLADNMKGAFGPELSAQFEHAVNSAIQNGLAAIRQAKDEVNTSILQIEGKISDEDTVSNDMGAADPGGDAAADLGADEFSDAAPVDGGQGELNMDGGDDVFGGDPAASGPADEPLGRARRESVETTGKFNLRESGERLLMQESLDSLIAWLFENAAATMPAPQLGAFAAQVAGKAAADPQRLAGWIGKKKYGAGLAAQLQNPLEDTTSTEEIAENAKTLADLKAELAKEEEDHKRNKGYDDFPTTRHEANAKIAKLKKQIAALSEGKSFKRDEDDNADSKKKASKQTRSDRKNAKQVDESAEALTGIAAIVEAISQKILSNIQESGKGRAAEAIRECALFESLNEGETATVEAVLEAFQARFGATPAQYSIAQARAVREAAPMTPQQKKNAGVVTKVAATLATDKTAANKSISSAMTGMDGAERSTMQKMVNDMKKSGKNPQKLGDFVAGAASEVEEDAQPTSGEKKFASEKEFHEFIVALKKEYGVPLGRNVKEETNATDSGYEQKMRAEFNALSDADLNQMLIRIQRDIRSGGNLNLVHLRVAHFVAMSIYKQRKNGKVEESSDEGEYETRPVIIRGVMGMDSKAFHKRFKNGIAMHRWMDKHEGNIEVHDYRVDESAEVMENINAAHWPVDETGQYKGDAFSTDYNKLKAPKSTKANSDSEGGASETKVEEPSVDSGSAAKADKPAEEKKEKASAFGGKQAKPFEKKAKAPKEESKEEPTADSDEDK